MALNARSFAATVTTAVVLLWAPFAHAAHQPLALGAQDLSIDANGVASAVGYCLDQSLHAPHEDTTLTNLVDGRAKVCFGNHHCISLQEAIDQGVVKITGAQGYQLRFINLKPFPVTVRIGEGAVLSDAATVVKAPAIKFSTDRHSNLEQYKTWRALGQLSDFALIRVRKDGSSLAIDARDTEGRDVTFAGVSDAELAPTLAHFAATQDVELQIEVHLPTRDVEALMENLRVHGAANGMIAFVGMTESKMGDFMGDVKISNVAARTTSSTRIEASCTMTTDRTSLPTKLVVILHKPEPLSTRERLADATHKVMDRLSLGAPQDVLATATTMRDAVKDEISALRASTDWSRDSVWLMVGDAAGAHILVLLSTEEATWPA
jgi:hypothetical protein